MASLALSGELESPACNPPSANKIWGTVLAVVAPGLIPGAHLESPMASPWFLVIGVPAPHQTGPPTRTLHDDDHNPRCVLCVSCAGCWEWPDAQVNAARCHSPVRPCNPSTRLSRLPAPSLPPLLRPLILHARLALLPSWPLPPGLTDVSRGHVPLHLSNSLLPCVVCCLSMVNGGPRAWLLLDGVTDRLTRRAFRGPTHVRCRRPLPLPRCSF